MEEEEEKNQKANMEDFVEVAGEEMSVKNLEEKYESAMCKDNSEDEDEKENSEEEASFEKMPKFMQAIGPPKPVICW